MQNLTCIVCPIGCSLEVNAEASDNLSVTGNRCARGSTYAQEEIRAPKRVVTATAPLAAPLAAPSVTSAIRRIPVKTVAPCLKEKIPALLQDIYKVKVSLPVKVGDVIISNWNGEGIDVVATRALG
jgi:CxxC motif-containing protein